LLKSLEKVRKSPTPIRWGSLSRTVESKEGYLSGLGQGTLAIRFKTEEKKASTKRERKKRLPSTLSSHYYFEEGGPKSSGHKEKGFS